MHWKETTFVLHARVDGYNNEEVSVQFRGKRVLFIIAESPSCGRFMKRIQLPEDVNVGQTKTVVADEMSMMISSSFRHGCTNIMDPFSVIMHWQETTFVLHARVDGYNNEEASVQFRDKRVLFIIAESPSCGRFMKRIQLPEDVNVGQTKTVVADGMLIKIIVPKGNVNQPQIRLRNNSAIIASVSRRHRGCFFW
ncbi:17.6 kDa class I heat shock protein-like [Juglans regia]|uniref:17.6 kDa class I heat shock protein-like n=1 Tax=Juglans regia TaxID=51240 RepID=A0A2I4FFW3_JUGRE|nr:17.6 kDa class I heat shock protein-like [Juglans regia]